MHPCQTRGVVHQLAQVNVSRLVAPLDSRTLSGFVRNHDRVNAAAARAPGFVWRLQNDLRPGQAVDGFDWDRDGSVGMVVNISVWDDVESLRSFTYDEVHRSVLARRREWFVPMEEANLALWWISSGHRPAVEEAADRLRHLRAHGPTPYAFTLVVPFPPE